MDVLAEEESQERKKLKAILLIEDMENFFSTPCDKI